MAVAQQQKPTQPVLNYKGVGITKYLAKNLRYPKEFREDCSSGMMLVAVSFSVAANGKVNDIAVEGIKSDTSRHALEKLILNTDGYWKVPLQKSPKMKTMFLAPILFRREYWPEGCNRLSDNYNGDFENALNQIISWNAKNQRHVTLPLVTVLAYPSIR